MTNNLLRRIWEHKYGTVEGFTKKYRVTDLIFFEDTPDVYSALTREKQIKKWSRKKKLALIQEKNPQLQTLRIS